MRISEAFSVLSDKKLKSKYDRRLRRHTRGGFGSNTIDFEFDIGDIGDIGEALSLFAVAFGMDANNINWDELSADDVTAWVKKKAKERYVPCPTNIQRPRPTLPVATIVTFHNIPHNNTTHAYRASILCCTQICH